MIDVEQVDPGDRITIQGVEYDIRSKNVDVSGGNIVTGFHIMAVEHGDPLTNHTISRLKVDQTPNELRVCNGPTHEIDPEDIRYVGAETDRRDE